MMTSGTLVICSLSRSNNGTRMRCSNGSATGSSIDSQWYETLEEID